MILLYIFIYFKFCLLIIIIIERKINYINKNIFKKIDI